MSIRTSDNSGRRNLPIELRTVILAIAFISGGYFAWERYSTRSEPTYASSAPLTSGHSASSALVPQIDSKAPHAAKQYVDLVRYMTAEGSFGMIDDQSKVPAGAKVLGVERREIQPQESDGGAVTQHADNHRNGKMRSGLAPLQLEQEQAALRAQRDAEDAASSSSPSSSARGRSPCRESPGSPHEVFCNPSRSRSVDEVSVHP
jgi:hypothetical protein